MSCKHLELCLHLHACKCKYGIKTLGVQPCKNIWSCKCKKSNPRIPHLFAIFSWLCVVQHL